MKKGKPSGFWDMEDAGLAEQKAEERAYGVDDSEGLEYAERMERERQAEALYRPIPKKLAKARKSLVPKSAKAFQSFSRAVFENGSLSTKMKHLIAVAVAHVTQCPYCIRGHTQAALKSGATQTEIMEAIWVAAEMRAGATYEHSILALDKIMNRPARRRRKRSSGQST
jgi:AhpD family alkylhydroperoxidase